MTNYSGQIDPMPVASATFFRVRGERGPNAAEEEIQELEYVLYLRINALTY